MAEKSVDNLLKGLEASKDKPFDRLLFGLGIRFVGATVAKKLARYFTNIDNLMNASFEDLIGVDEIGDRIAESLVNYFDTPDNLDRIEFLKQKGLTFAVSEEDASKRTNLLEGKSIVVSGVFSKMSRDDIKTLIEDNGGKNTSSVSKNTSFVVAGENMGPSKLAKAEKLGIELFSEDDFLKLVSKDV